MGIGADDIFVFADLWKESGNHRGAYRTIAHRLGHVYGHAGKAMLVTSLTTAISFFANVSSGFIGVSTFGIFAGAAAVQNKNNARMVVVARIVSRFCAPVHWVIARPREVAQDGVMRLAF